MVLILFNAKGKCHYITITEICTDIQKQINKLTIREI